MTDDQTPTARPEGLTMDERALLLDARSHRRTGAGCSSCIDGIELLAARTADLRGEVARWRERWQATIADASKVMAERDRLAVQVERVRALADEVEQDATILTPSTLLLADDIRAALDPTGPRQTDDGGDLRGLEGGSGSECRRDADGAQKADNDERPGGRP